MNHLFIIQFIIEKLLQPELLTTLSSCLEAFNNFLQVATGFLNSLEALLESVKGLIMTITVSIVFYRIHCVKKSSKVNEKNDDG
ncbi:hypothetical protein J1C81_08675 [Streptococcus sanguinis]|uniref:D-erythrose 4-phosphate dehydrogenase n=1 Tax=Streptococcus sanguinis SK330 TaxID=888813 RepID=F2C7W5_STRSA|nr:hypothetical protein [Streptococcus sanguinis]EGF14537.1 D-erythrose 4-phosphate dehydrogenase [Streptococcus sanguinis SK330]